MSSPPTPSPRDADLTPARAARRPARRRSTRHLPPRWSRNNPVDCAGGETRDTIPTVLRLLAEHPDVDAIVYLGLGIQSNQARHDARGRLLSRARAGADRRVPRAPGPALRRGCGRARRTAAASRSCAPPSWRSPIRPTPARRQCATTGRLAYPSGERAVAALGHLYRYARHRARRTGMSRARSRSGRKPTTAATGRWSCSWSPPSIPALLLLAVARWAGGQADASDDAVPAADPSRRRRRPRRRRPALNTGLLSFRRAASKLSRDLNMAAFQQGVQPLMNSVGDRSCAAISLDGELVGEKNIDTVVIPASNMKILVAAAAIERARRRLPLHDPRDRARRRRPA